MADPANTTRCDLPLTSQVRVGPAGWSYDDWEGIVYPEDKRLDHLQFIASLFDTVEINSTFYRPVAKTVAKNWSKRVEGNPRFRFTAKLHRVFTHDRGNATAEVERQFREGIDALVEAHIFGALLLQFPWSFKNDQASRAYLAKLLDQFREYPLVVEVRHASWNRPATYESLERRAVGFCNIDQPLFTQSISPSAVVTSKIGYVRLHGRNYDHWFAENKDPGARYNYLYEADELEPWIDKIRELLRHSSQVYVIANNHYQGKAAVNGLQIRAMLEQRKVRAPESLLSRYPSLAEFATERKE